MPDVAAPAQADVVRADIASVAAQVVSKLKDGDKQFEIRLDPADYGRVDVRLSVANDGRASAHFAADNPQTLELLQRDQSVLHRALKEAGIDLQGGSLNFSLSGQQRGTGNGFRSGAASLQRIARAEPIASQPIPSRVRAAEGGVDIRV